MNPAPFFIAGAVLLLLKAYTGTQASPLNRVYVLGDSQVANGMFSKELRSRTSTEIINGGTGGYGIRQLRKEWLPHLLSYQPDLVLLWAGVNDIASQRGAKHVKEQIELLRDEVSPAQLVVFEIPPWGGYGRYSDQLKFEETPRANAAMHTIDGITVIPTGMLGKDGILNPSYTWKKKSTGQPEGLHMSKAGYKVMADLAEDYLPFRPLPKALGVVR